MITSTKNTHTHNLREFQNFCGACKYICKRKPTPIIFKKMLLQNWMLRKKALNVHLRKDENHLQPVLNPSIVMDPSINHRCLFATCQGSPFDTLSLQHHPDPRNPGMVQLKRNYPKSKLTGRLGLVEDDENVPKGAYFRGVSC